MRYLLRCDKCAATCWKPGIYEGDTNALCLNDDAPEEWTGGEEGCEHQDFTVVDEETSGE